MSEQDQDCNVAETKSRVPKWFAKYARSLASSKSSELAGASTSSLAGGSEASAGTELRATLCTRLPGHSGPCNGFPTFACPGYDNWLALQDSGEEQEADSKEVVQSPDLTRVAISSPFPVIPTETPSEHRQPSTNLASAPSDAGASLGFSLFARSLWDTFRTFLNKLYVHYRVEVSEKAKCPACGHRVKHNVEFHPMFQALIHSCEFCKAMWPERPVVAAEHWMLAPTVAEPEQEDKERKTRSASREPIIVKK